jgi:hypothetical protein
VYAVHVVHSAELDPPRGAALVADPEQPELRRPLTDLTRRGYLTAFGAWRAELARRWRSAGAIYTEVVTSEPAAQAVRRVALASASGAVSATGSVSAAATSNLPTGSRAGRSMQAPPARRSAS